MFPQLQTASDICPCQIGSKNQHGRQTGGYAKSLNTSTGTAGSRWNKAIVPKDLYRYDIPIQIFQVCIILAFCLVWWMRRQNLCVAGRSRYGHEWSLIFTNWTGSCAFLGALHRRVCEETPHHPTKSFSYSRLSIERLDPFLGYSLDFACKDWVEKG